MTTIDYDLPVLDFVSRLDDTGHVTHTSYRKDIVTLHHNGGRLTHDGVMSVWTTRPASAHFNVDAKATLAQFVRLNEYAWATGNTEGNQRSISIEMANETVAPEWRVGELTWHAAARLVGWIHARVFGWRPSRESLVVHHYWSSTACAGPYIDEMFDRILEISINYYNQFTAGHGGPEVPPPSSGGGKGISELVDEVIAGEWGNGYDRRARLTEAGYDYDIVQNAVNERLGGYDPHPNPKTNEEIVDEVLRGEWGNDPERRARLLDAGYDSSLIQSLVNRRLAGGAPTGIEPQDFRLIASAVIRGEWDNGENRRRLLEAAGYNYREVQDEVNRQLGL